MKKSLLSLAVIAVSLSACDTTPKYNINGTITGGEANNVYLLQRQGRPLVQQAIGQGFFDRFHCFPQIGRKKEHVVTC